MNGHPERILRLPEVLVRVGLSSATIYRRINDGTFPRQIKLSVRSVGWKESQITAWINDRVSTYTGRVEDPQIKNLSQQPEPAERYGLKL